MLNHNVIAANPPYGVIYVDRNYLCVLDYNPLSITDEIATVDSARPCSDRSFVTRTRNSRLAKPFQNQTQTISFVEV